MHRAVICSLAAMAVIAMVFSGTSQRAGAASLAEVRQVGSLRVCANPSALPYSNLADKGGLAGFEVELAQALAKEMGLGLDVRWVRSASDMKNADCDALMGAIASAVSYDREGRIGPLTTRFPLRYSRPYAAGGVVLVVSSGSSVRRLEDLHTRKVGVAVGTVEHEWLDTHGFRVSVFPSQEDIIAAIEAGEIEIGATSPVAIGWYQHEHPGTAVKVPDGYKPEAALRWDISVGLRRADDALIAAVDRALKRIVEQRLPAQIYAKYGITYLPPSAAGFE
jgi:ABC-type amino acid transport substrate-binding protein